MSNSFFAAYYNSDLFGKAIFFSLFALSIISWTIIIQRLRTQRQAKRRCQDFQRTFLSSETNPLAIKLSATTILNPFSTIYQNLRIRCLRILEKNKTHSNAQHHFLSPADMESLGGQLDYWIASQTRRLGKHLFVLNLIVTLAPFLGLLGTVWGSLTTLSALRHQHTLTGNGLVLEGLSMALATTVLGLLVAIPALVGHAVLKARARELVRDTGDFSTRVLAAIEMQYRRVDA